MTGKGAVLASLAAVLAGVGVSVQTSLNGHANVAVGSPILATAINHSSALILALVVALAIGAFPRALRELRSGRVKLRWWWFLGGAMGAGGVFVIVAVTPLVGVVAVAVAVTLGQLAGSVLVDSMGMGAGGRRSLTVLRLMGMAVAVVAVLIGAEGRFGGGAWVVLPLAVAAGVIIAIQQAANGWLIIATGEFAVMSVINFAVSVLLVGVALAVAMVVSPVNFSAIPVWAPIGGVLGALIGVVAALTANKIGVLSLMLCVAAGQAIGGVFLDMLVPVDRVGLTGGSVAAAVLAVCAVGLAGMGSMGRSWKGRPRRASHVDTPEGRTHEDIQETPR